MISEKYKPENILNGGNKEEKPSINVEQILPKDENIELRPGESQASYLQRAGEAVTKKLGERFGRLFDPGRSKEESLPQDVVAMIEDIATEALKNQENYTDKKTEALGVSDIRDSIGYHNRGDLADSDSFDTAQRNRKFFEIQPGKGAAKRETYWSTLFFPYNTKATRELAKKMLDDKTIVLLGGGRSKIKKELAEIDINPREIVNVDPFVENVEEGADRVVPLSASADDFIERIGKEGVTGADEVWAEYSVPAYLDDPGEIRQLVRNIDALLVEGGTARIWPLEVGGRGDEKDRLLRKDSLAESIKEIEGTGKYEASLYVPAAGRHGLILHKLAPSREELQKKDDEEKIREIREQLGLNS